MLANTGITPDYFLDKMQDYELEPILRGIYEKQKISWEQTRLLAHRVVSCWVTKPISPDQLLALPWDTEKKEKVVTTPPSPELVEKLEKLVNNV